MEREEREIAPKAVPVDLPGVVPASAFHRIEGGEGWDAASLAGRLVEISASEAPAALTVAVRLVLDAQRRGEPAAWVTTRESAFFPPDAAEHGIDLEALAVVRVPDAASIPRAAATLVRSGAFLLVVLDLGADADVPMALQARLVKLGQSRETAVVCLTTKPADAPSIGSLVSLRGEARRTRSADGRFVCEIRILKDKRRAPTWRHREEYRGPVGLP